MNLTERLRRHDGGLVAIFLLLVLLLPGQASAGLAEGWAAFAKMDYDAAIAAVDELAGKGDTEACYLLGMLHDPAFHLLPSGRFYQSKYFDVGLAIRLYRQAADDGDGRAMHHLAELYLLLEDDRWGPQRPDDIANLTNAALTLRRKSTPLLRDLAKQGDFVAAYMLAEARRDDSHFFSAIDNARNVLEMAAWRDNALSQLYLGRTFLVRRVLSVKGSYTMDPPEAFAWFTVAARNGNMHARVYQLEAAEMIPIREHARAEELTRALLDSLKKKAAVTNN